MTRPSDMVRIRKAGLGAAALGGAIVIGLGLSYAAASSSRPGKTATPNGAKGKGTDGSSKVEKGIAIGKKSSRTTAVYTFGYNQYGQLMLGDETDVFSPKKINFTQESVSKVRASSKTSALLTNVGHVFTAGCGMDGRLGTGITIPPFSAPDQTNPMQIPNLENIKSLSLGEYGGAAIDDSGALFTWGRSWGGENGHNDSNPGFPERVLHDSRVLAVSRGRQHLAFLDENGKVMTAGVGREGALGLGTFSNVSKPSQVKGALEGVDVSVVVCGRESTYAVTSSGRLYSWGNDDSGSLGLGKVERRVAEPRLVSSLSGVTVSQVACGEGFTAVVSDTGDVFMSGKGSDGQLATGNRDDSAFFVKVLGLPGPVKKVSCGGGHVAALLENGSLFVWGRGRNGQLGRSDHIESVAAPRLTPVECSFFAGMKVLDVACGGDHTIVLVES